MEHSFDLIRPNGDFNVDFLGEPYVKHLSEPVWRRTTCTTIVLAALALLFASGSPANAEILYVSSFDQTVKQVGSGGSPVTTFATGYNNPYAITFDSTGNLYAADFNSSQILKVGPGGGAATVFATGLSGPAGLAFDSVGNLFVANQGNGTVSVIGPGGGVATPFASGLSVAAGLAIDASGNIYASNLFAQTISEFAPNGTLINAAFATVSGGEAIGMAFDQSGNMYISSGSVVQTVGPSGGAATTFATGFGRAFGLTFDSAGNLFVADLGGSVREVGPGGGASTIYASVPGATGVAFAPASAVPEPSSFVLLGLGGIGLAIGAYRRRCVAVD